MHECPECGTALADSHARCPSCGYAIAEATRTCEQCRETIAADADACPACGHLHTPGRCDRHPGEVAVGRCALCGVLVCPQCDVGRRYHRCEDHRDVPIIEGWAQVLSVPDDVEARLIEENLRAEGIDSRLLSTKDHFALPVEFGDLARVRILVPAYIFQEAERVLTAHRDAAGNVAFGCLNCGEPYEEGQTTCSVCGESLV